MSKKCFSSKRTSQPRVTSYQTTDHMTKQKINRDLQANSPKRRSGNSLAGRDVPPAVGGAAGTAVTHTRTRATISALVIPR